MINGRSISSLAFFLVSLLGALYLAVEAVLQVRGTSICSGEGCRVVAQYSRFGDLPIVLAGLAVMALLAVLAGLGLRSESRMREQAIDLLLVSSLAAEGFFAGFQVFWINRLCVFCISVFSLFVVLGLLRAAAGRRETLAGFGALAAVLVLFLLLLPPGGSALPLDQKHVLFFSPDCKHCAEIKSELAAGRIEYLPVNVKEHAALLRNLGIQDVPTLLVNGPYEKVFLTGVNAIRGYLASCAGGAPASAAKERRRAAPTAHRPAEGPKLDIFPPTLPGNIFNPPPDEGLCKENVKCE